MFWLYFIIVVLLLVIYLQCRRHRAKIQELNAQLSEHQQARYSAEDELAYHIESARQKKANSQRRKEDKDEEKAQKELCEMEMRDYIDNHLSEVFYVKRSLFSDFEQKAYYFLCISEDIGKNFFHLEQNYYVFPQPNVYAFVQISKKCPKMDNPDFSEYALRTYLSKSVDFLICTKKYIPSRSDPLYIPTLAIEIDGPYHNKDPRTIRNDQLKSRLLQGLNFPLERIPVTDDDRVTPKKIHAVISKHLAEPQAARL